jgi:hypothetical protein
MRGDISLLPQYASASNTPSRCDAQLKYRDNFTFTLPIVIVELIFSRQVRLSKAVRPVFFPGVFLTFRLAPGLMQPPNNVSSLPRSGGGG